MIWRRGEPSHRYIRVLLVDDDEEDALIARELLDDSEHVRFAVTWARDAAQALTLLVSEPFDVCLLDLRLGADSGLHVLAEARERGLELPIVMLTGQGDRDSDLQAMEAGATDYLVKGKLDAALLERTVRYAIVNHAQQQAIARHAQALEVAQGDLERANTRLAEIVRRQNEILGMAAHDLRSPLGIVLGYVGLLQGVEGIELAEGERVDVLARVQSSVRFMVNVIDDLLDISAIESGTIDIDLRPSSLGDVVGATAGAMRIVAAAKGITLKVEEPPAPVVVRADARRLDQVVCNLVSNAIKYSQRDGEVRVRIESDPKSARIVVEDDGIGIAPEFRARMFTPFAKGQRAGTAGEKSAGLGLAIVKRIVDAHGGSIAVESEPGRGARFVVELRREA